MIDKREKDIIEFIKQNPEISSKEIFEGISMAISYASVKRVLSKLIEKNLIIKIGHGKSTRYTISPTYELLFPVDVETYFEKEIDDRVIKERFNLRLIPDTLATCSIFTANELEQLELLQKKFLINISQLSEKEYIFPRPFQICANW